MPIKLRHVVTLTGAPIAWHSRTTPQVALSSAASELMATVECVREVPLVRRMAKWMGWKQHKPTPLMEDSQPCTSMMLVQPSPSVHSSSHDLPTAAELRCRVSTNLQVLPRPPSTTCQRCCSHPHTNGNDGTSSNAAKSRHTRTCTRAHTHTHAHAHAHAHAHTHTP